MEKNVCLDLKPLHVKLSSVSSTVYKCVIDFCLFVFCQILPDFVVNKCFVSCSEWLVLYVKGMCHR